MLPLLASSSARSAAALRDCTTKPSTSCCSFEVGVSKGSRFAIAPRRFGGALCGALGGALGAALPRFFGGGSGASSSSLGGGGGACFFGAGFFFAGLAAGALRFFDGADALSRPSSFSYLVLRPV